MAHTATYPERPRPALPQSDSELTGVRNVFNLFAEAGHTWRIILRLAEPPPDASRKEAKNVAEDFLLANNLEMHRNALWHTLDQLNLMELEAVRDIFLLLRDKDMIGSSIT